MMIRDKVGAMNP